MRTVRKIAAFLGTRRFNLIDLAAFSIAATLVEHGRPWTALVTYIGGTIFSTSVEMASKDREIT